MASQALPTLDTAGWVTDVAEKAERLLGYFITSEASQSNIFLCNIQSLPAVIQSTGSDFIILRRTVEDQINALFRPYFQGVTTNVTIEPITINGIASDAQFTIRLELKVSEGGVNHSLGRLLSVSNSSLNKVSPLTY